ncbi:MAG: D-tyrosyl-tRNA(Tyr) deacylase [Pseudonocardiales bacterium]|nr:D-tyrosyl-tRNA(Tyr) deacylase [Jatrophihabitantaceae bacterium]MCW2604747.1 D-tyrosyl-tRNA(Tyr) deacylase [Pseudonocardiales bacterium]
MRAVVSRVTWARVVVEGETVGEIDAPGGGLLVLVGVAHADTAAQAADLARKVHQLRILRGDTSCEQTGGPLLVVSQFTLYADTGKGRRPSWLAAAGGAVAEPLVRAVVEELRRRGATVATGVFGADMTVESHGDGPVTILLDL